MVNQENIIEEINIRRENIPSLVLYLKELRETKFDVKDKHVFELLLKDKDEIVKSFSVKLLFDNFKLDVKDYLNELIDIVSNKNEDFDLRLECSNKIASRFAASQDQTIMKVLYDLYKDRFENSILRSTFLEGTLIIYGLTVREIVLRNKGLSLKLDDFDLNLFDKEIHEIENIIQ